MTGSRRGLVHIIRAIIPAGAYQTKRPARVGPSKRPGSGKAYLPAPVPVLCVAVVPAGGVALVVAPAGAVLPGVLAARPVTAGRTGAVPAAGAPAAAGAAAAAA